MENAKRRPKFVVGLDFGTTFSGFAFTRVTDPEVIHNFYEWPDLGAAGGTHYCKTITSLLYLRGHNDKPGPYVFSDWGYSARLKYVKISNMCRSSKTSGQQPQLLTNFKLHLAGTDSENISLQKLPDGIDSRRAISDYLFHMSNFILSVLQSSSETHVSMGTKVTMKDVQWCLTVPAIWAEKSKQEMKTCAEIAGMVRGPACNMERASPHDLLIVLEPEAASLYCQRLLVSSFPSDKGDKYMIVDVGGGTVDLVLHEKMSSDALQVRELASSTGGLCGGTFVDKNLFEFLCQKISCFEKFCEEHPESLLQLRGRWEYQKYAFDGNVNSPIFLDLPPRLAKAWEKAEPKLGSDPDFYDVVKLSVNDLKKVFDPVIGQIIRLIEKMIIPDLKAMLLVGGFSASPYLQKNIREVFDSSVGTILVPNEPACAICSGAVLFGVYGPDIILSRISRKTYGVGYSRSFRDGDPDSHRFQTSDGRVYCRNVFSVYTTKGNEVPLNHNVTETYFPIENYQTSCTFALYSTNRTDARYITDEGLQKEGCFTIRFPCARDLRETPEIEVSMYFGRSTIEVTAVGQNFGNGEKFKMETVKFEKTYDTSAGGLSEERSLEYI